MSSTHFDIEKDNARFFRISRRTFITFAVLTCVYLTALTYSTLMDNPSYMQDWRGITCIALTILAFLIYLVHFRVSLKGDWPPRLSFSVSLWVSLYLVVLLLTLINNAFAWDFYAVYAISFGLFGGVRLLVAVGSMALTMFAFQGLLIWPPTSAAIMTLASQVMTISSITGFYIMFQNLVGERFERNDLFKQLAQANTELEEAHRQLAQSVVQEQELAVLRERTRLAREMHDTIGHALVLISVKLEAARRLRERDPARCDHELESTAQIARETMTALRASIANLRSPVLEQERISHALSRAVRELAQRTGLDAAYTHQADIDFLPPALEETLWKVSQEALTNIEKHAHASHVQVRISQQDQKLLLYIHDDGIGLPQAVYQPQKAGSLVQSNGHYGLRGMRERVEAVGGHLTLHPGEGQGTTIEVELPLAPGEPLDSAPIHLGNVVGGQLA